MLSIQDLVKETGVSSRMLRYYDEKGLLHPIYRSESGIRYYDESAIGALSLIGTFLSLGYRVDEIQNLLSEESFSPQKVLDIVQTQKENLLLQKQKTEQRLRILEGLDTASISEMTSWKEVKEQLHQIMSEIKIKESHQTPQQLLHNSWRRQGSDFNEWMRFMFAPVVFTKKTMTMAEINASNGYYWLYNEDRLPKGKLDLFYDPSIRKGTDSPKKNGLKTTWRSNADLTTIADEAYELIFNDHIHFYKDQVKEGILQMYRLLKQGGSLYLICEDPTHDGTLKQWKRYIDPLRTYREQFFKDHYTSDILLPLLKQIFTNVIDHPRKNVYRVTEEEEFLLSLKNECHLETSDHPGQLRFDHVAKEIHKLIKTQGYIERVSYYHVLEAKK